MTRMCIYAIIDLEKRLDFLPSSFIMKLIKISMADSYAFTNKQEKPCKTSHF